MSTDSLLFVFVLVDDRNFILGFYFLNLGIRHLCVSTLTLPNTRRSDDTRADEILHTEYAIDLVDEELAER